MNDLIAFLEAHKVKTTVHKLRNGPVAKVEVLRHKKTEFVGPPRRAGNLKKKIYTTAEEKRLGANARSKRWADKNRVKIKAGYLKNRAFLIARMKERYKKIKLAKAQPDLARSTKGLDE